MGVGLMSGSCRVQKVRVALDTAAQRTGGLFPLYLSATDCCDTRPLACPAPIHCAAGCTWRAHNADRAARCAGPVQVFRQRLEQEHGASVIVTAPTVPCRWAAAGCCSARCAWHRIELLRCAARAWHRMLPAGTACLAQVTSA